MSQRQLLSRSFSERMTQRLTLTAVCVATFMILLDITIVNVALPRIQSGLGMTPGGLEWVVSGYALVLAAAIPAAGTLGDLYGRKRLFVIGMVIFVLGSLACALSKSAPELITSRALEALGGAMMLALSLSIIAEVFEPERRAGAIGIWAAISGTGFALGPVVGGLLLSSFDWSSVFWVNVPVGVAGVVLLWLVVPESRAHGSHHVDYPGVTLSAAGLVALTLGLVDASSHPWSSWLVAGPLAVGAGALWAFVVWEHHARDPMMPSTLLRARGFTSASGVYLVIYAAQEAMLFYATLMYQDVMGWSPLRTGLSWLFMSGTFFFVAQSAGRFQRRTSARVLSGVGCALTAAGLFAVSFAAPGRPFVLTAAGYVIAGAGFGLVNPGATYEAMRDVPSGVSGAASGVFNASRQLGTSMGLAVLGAVGVGATVSAWSADVARMPLRLRPSALAQSQNVGVAHLKAVEAALGSVPSHVATDAFVHGYHFAVLGAAGCALAACALAFAGFPRHRSAA